MSVLISGPPEAIRGSKVDVVRLRRCGEKLLSAIGESKSELSIALVDDPEIEILNTQWRTRPTPTDVLSFSQIEGEKSGGRARLLGDVVISVETASRQAAASHRGLDERVIRLLIHGLLHLIGHDHEEDEEASRMGAEERRLWLELKS
jgi:probable rRNA maturation factor